MKFTSTRQKIVNILPKMLSSKAKAVITTHWQMSKNNFWASIFAENSMASNRKILECLQTKLINLNGKFIPPTYALYFRPSQRKRITLKIGIYKKMKLVSVLL